MSSSRKLLLAIMLSGVVLIAEGLPAVAAGVPAPVLTDPKVDTSDAAATANHLAWDTNSASAQSHYNVMFADRGSTSTTKVNATGTEGAHPRALFGTEQIVYQQYTSSSSDIYLYNMATKQRTKLGAKVNTKAWEYWPAASTKYVLFLRITSTERQLLLYNRKSNSIRKITSAPSKCSSCLHPDWVGTNHAIYSVCSRSNYACKVKVLTIGGSTQTVPGKSAPYSQYGGAMDEARGDVYYISSTTYCGLFAELDRWNIGGGTPVLIDDFAEGFDGNEASVAPSATTPGDVDVFFSDWECLKSDADIYEIDSANTIT